MAGSRQCHPQRSIKNSIAAPTATAFCTRFERASPLRPAIRVGARHDLGVANTLAATKPRPTSGACTLPAMPFSVVAATGVQQVAAVTPHRDGAARKVQVDTMRVHFSEPVTGRPAVRRCRWPTVRRPTARTARRPLRTRVTLDLLHAEPREQLERGAGSVEGLAHAHGGWNCCGDRFVVRRSACASSGSARLLREWPVP